MDFEHVRRVRERGMLGLCQTLKSFRDHPMDFPPYRDKQADPGAFAQLGPLEVPQAEDPADTADVDWTKKQSATGTT